MSNFIPNLISYLFLSFGILCGIIGAYNSFAKRSTKYITLLEAVDRLYPNHRENNFEAYLPFIFSDSESEHDPKIRQIVYKILVASKQGKISLFGKRKNLSIREISPYDIQLDRVRYDANDLPILCDHAGKPIFTDLRVERKLIKNLIEEQ